MKFTVSVEFNEQEIAKLNARAAMGGRAPRTAAEFATYAISDALQHCGFIESFTVHATASTSATKETK
jgi:isopentenyl diphosphate isomerase/L-lactate dehydrogenase-like FMN-dependent dehydrogenase